MNKLYVVGIGYSPLNDHAAEVVLSAETILASDRLLEVFKRYKEYDSVKDRIKVINKINDIMEFIRSSLSTFNPVAPLVLLASGDPLFFGIGRRVVEEFGRENVELIPDLSSIQLAFARIGEPWDNAFLISLHGGPDPEKRRRLPYELKDIPMLLKKHRKIAILTDRENSPPVIAAHLSGEKNLTMHVCERLGYPEEKIVNGAPEEIRHTTFRDPNVVIVMLSADEADRSEPVFGLRENDITHSRGLITKDEVRAVSIHKLRLPQKGVVWDIGAGSGSVSLEISGLSHELKVYAIEKNEEQIRNIADNIARFWMSNVLTVSGEAPDILRTLPAPDRVFIGGSSGQIRDIVGLISGAMPKGVIVINATTLETLNEAMEALSGNAFEVDVSEISVSRSKRIAGKMHMSALNPVFVIRGER